MFSLVVAWLQSPLGVSWLRLLTMEVLQLPCSRPRWIVAGLQLAHDGNYLQNQSQNHITTDGQSSSKSWCQAPSEAQD
jgi:hypothetical protein